MAFLAWLLTNIAPQLAKVALDALLDHMPQITAALKSAAATTIRVAPPEDPAIVTGVNQEISDAIQTGQVPPPGTKL